MLIRIPTKFFIDHEERALPTPVVVTETKRHFWINSDDPALGELLDDAKHYAHPYGPVACEVVGRREMAAQRIGTGLDIG